MKTLKLNFAFLCMLAMIAVSVCMTSCTKEDVPTNQDTNIVDANELEDGQYGIFIPQELSEQGDEKKKEYVNSLSEEQRTEQVNNFIISNFISKKAQESGDLEDGQVKDFSQEKLSDYLTENEISELNSLLVISGDIESRGCYVFYCYKWYCNCYVYCGYICN